MGARVRRRGQAGLAILIVVVSLLGSALLAAGLSAPHGSTYPSMQVRIKGAGFCVDRFAHRRFSFEVQRKANGQLRGEFGTQLGPDRQSFRGGHLMSLTTGGRSASFSVTGELTGGNSDHGAYTADVTVTDEPDTVAISVRSTGVVYSVACRLTTGGILITTR